MAGPPFNFSAGPAILPPEVLERAAEAVRELRADAHAKQSEGIGLSLLEISHRSKAFTEILEAAFELCHEVIGIPRTHRLLFLQGGASAQFAMLPLNLRRAGVDAGFVDTGVWSQKAIRESKLSQGTRIVASSSDTGYDRIPELPALESGTLSYLHLTTNNTIHGTEYSDIPQAGDVPLVADLSSHIGSRPMALERLAVGYAGAQKNLGPSGVTLVFIEADFAESLEVEASVPHFFRYATHLAKNSVYNTPNTFGILVLKVVLEWLRDLGGVEAAGRRNADKATLLYDCLDESQLFTPMAQPGHRSQMNVSWSLGGVPEASREGATQRFLGAAGDAGFLNLKGHRSVGGCRASIYNAFPREGVEALVEFMREYERTAAEG